MTRRKHYGELHDQKRATRSCGKTRYRTRGIAEEAKRGLSRQMGENIRVYGCPDCGGFHLTSKATARVQVGRGAHGLHCTCEACLAAGANGTASDE